MISTSTPRLLITASSKTTGQRELPDPVRKVCIKIIGRVGNIEVAVPGRRSQEKPVKPEAEVKGLSKQERRGHDQRAMSWQAGWMAELFAAGRKARPVMQIGRAPNPRCG
jgi:hypothetical protein